MGFVIKRGNGFQKQSLGKTTARRRANAEKVALHSVAAGVPVSDMLPELVISWLNPSELKGPRRRVRKSEDKHVADTVRSIGQFGFVSPVILRGDTVVDGWIRVLATRALRLEQIPCVDVSHLSDEQARLLAISLNRLAETGAWDMPELKLELTELAVGEIDLSVTGFTLPEIDIILSDEEHERGKEEEIPSAPQDPVTLPGDLWILGKHRVLCGSALEADDYTRLVGRALAAAVLTDPPYNVKIAGNVSGLGKVKHGEFAMGVGEYSRAEFQDFLAEPLARCKPFLMAGAIVYAFMDFRSIDLLMNAAASVGLKHLNTAVWHKGSGGMGAFLRSAHEFCGIFCSGDKPRVNNVELGKHGRDRTNVWTYPGANKPGTSGAKALKDHPTPKNVEMCADALRDATRRGELVLDPFLGSGTTLIAAQQSGRVCYGIELEPKFVDVIVRRWQELTGLEAEHADTELTFGEMATRRAPKDGGNAERETSADDASAGADLGSDREDEREAMERGTSEREGRKPRIDAEAHDQGD